MFRFIRKALWTILKTILIVVGLVSLAAYMVGQTVVFLVAVMAKILPMLIVAGLVVFILSLISSEIEK